MPSVLKSFQISILKITNVKATWNLKTSCLKPSSLKSLSLCLIIFKQEIHLWLNLGVSQYKSLMLRNCIKKISNEEIKCLVHSIQVLYIVLSSLMDERVFKIWPACSDYCYNYASKLQKEQLKCEWGIRKIFCMYGNKITCICLKR